VHAVSPNKLRGEADAYAFLERLSWGSDGPETCPHCGSDKGAWFLKAKDPGGRKSKGGSASRSHRRVWKCRESGCRRQFSVLTNTVMHGTKLPVQLWLEVVFALCTEDDGLSAHDVAERWGIAEKSAVLVLERIQQALETPEVAGASLKSNAPLWVRTASPETSLTPTATDQAELESTEQVVVDLTTDEPVLEVEPSEQGEIAPPAAPVAKPVKAVKPPAARFAKPAKRPAKPVKSTKPAKGVKPPAAVADPAADARPRDDRPRIDQKQVESDVQRVLAELVESEGLFEEGWLDTSPRRPLATDEPTAGDTA